MKRWRKAAVVPLMLLSAIIYNEFLVYYLVLYQCSWRDLNSIDDSQVKAMFISDPHLLGPRGHWWDRLRREWQMQRVFQTSLQLQKPELIFILGDIFDDGKWSSDEAFQEDVLRYNKIFQHSPAVQLVTVIGNHDVGFHYMINQHKLSRFVKAVNSSDSITLQHHKKISFVTVNSMALEGDDCQMCSKAKQDLKRISQKLHCAKNDWKMTEDCKKYRKEFEYSPPILLQHYPMYRHSEAECDIKDTDSIPQEWEDIENKPKYDCLSQDATKQLMTGIDPRLIISGHTHYFCMRKHTNGVEEWSIPSFSWRNHKGPSFLMVQFTPTDYAVSKCFMPDENTVYLVYGVTISLTVLYVLVNVTLIYIRKVKSKQILNGDQKHR